MGLVELVVTQARAASWLGPVAYVEADLFGGVGEQAAVVWEQGEAVFSPTVQQVPSDVPAVSVGPINAALRRVGVTAVDGRDEFDTVGLGRHRHLEDWAAG